MSDFLEQVVAERRAYAAEASARGNESGFFERLDNVASRAGPQSAHDLGWRAGGDHSDAFTGMLRQRRRERRLGLIAEVKRVSPVQGTLAADVDPARQARLYAEAGAAAISVLTEPLHWGGSIRDLVSVRTAVPTTPILCKDVIVSEFQIVEARNAGADAVLLIAEALTDAELRRFVHLAFTLDMGALVEAHEPGAFGRAVACGARIVGVNARDLRRPTQIDIGRVRQLHGFARADQILVAESGISSVDDARLLPARVDAMLVGTALMTSDDPTPLAHGLAHVARPVTA
ncbi:MAG: indole-3-glycerol-phosphate synthase [Chloroflexota bacterium]|nr:indole-3-glycerol-phosphate synthase [Chloroflexota bacterium]